MFTDTTYFDIFYDEPCNPVNQLPTMSAATGISGSFVSGGINYRWHSLSTNTLPVIPGENTTYCPNAFSTIFTVENMGNICSVQLLIVGGGGGGGFAAGGGGGQVVYIPNFPIRPGRYCCTRGNGGAGNQSGFNSGSYGNDSTVKLLYPEQQKNFISPIFTITAKGGGGGGTNGINSGNGASYGTGGGPNGQAIFNTSIYYNGKDAGASGFGLTGGAGGAGTTGSNAILNKAGDGGNGFGPLYMTGSTGEYYGGGAGGNSPDNISIRGFGGLGGGGNGYGLTVPGGNPSPATAGTDFLGGGGGSTETGGKGTVIITYKYQLD